ncbi:MAG: sigma-70 family RNA polymerase sigma factor [Oscillospiraceae bacterium]|nr:sigma-70 family RNA polymerase sigma factor [Oscillospiraceae bacterium]
MDNINKTFEVNNSFYEKYNPLIYKIAARVLNASGQIRDIDDCVSTVYLELMEKLQQYNETRGSMSTFVAVVARSVALNYCKSNIRKNSELIGNDKIDFINDPIEIENKVEFQMLVESIVKKLNEQENILFTFRYILFYSPEEIAKAFKINRNAVDGRLNRLKNKIKKLLIKGGTII